MATEVNDVERPEGTEKPAGPDPDLVEVVEKDGAKLVKLEALHGAREENKKLKDTIGKLEPLMPEFQEFLEHKRSGGSKPQQQQPQQKPQPQGPSADELEELDATAQLLGFVNPETGEADRQRTQQVLRLLDRRAGNIVGGAMRPVAASVAEQRARANRDQAYDKMYVDGRPVAEQEFIDMAFDSLPAEFSSDPTIAGVAHLLAAGLQYLEERKSNTRGARQQERPGVLDFLETGRTPARVTQRRREPMHVEGSLGRVSREDEDSMSDFSVAAARARGKSPEQWQKQRTAMSNRKSDILDEVY